LTIGGLAQGLDAHTDKIATQTADGICAEWSFHRVAARALRSDSTYRAVARCRSVGGADHCVLGDAETISLTEDVVEEVRNGTGPPLDRVYPMSALMPSC